MQYDTGGPKRDTIDFQGSIIPRILSNWHNQIVHFMQKKNDTKIMNFDHPFNNLISYMGRQLVHLMFITCGIKSNSAF